MSDEQKKPITNPINRYLDGLSPGAQLVGGGAGVFVGWMFFDRARTLRFFGGGQTEEYLAIGCFILGLGLLIRGINNFRVQK